MRGVIPILPTPFHDDGAVDDQPYAALVDSACRAGAAAVGVPAFGSEFYKLDAGERQAILERVLALAKGRIPVVVQCNHVCGTKAAAMARQAEALGAAAVNTALPRAFTGDAAALLAYARTVCDATSLPVVIQDWNPGGPTLGIDFVRALHRSCANFRFVKLEEGGIGALVRAIGGETGGAVQVLSGWGGLFLPELAPAGIAGIVPGMSLVDRFCRLWKLAEARDWAALDAGFAEILPFVALSLRNLEQFHHCEKRLLHRRGLLPNAVVRQTTPSLDPEASAYLDRLIAALLEPDRRGT
jgi:dihydrodipicolinate synthase/N-acetylneuraminate lyase